MHMRAHTAADQPQHAIAPHTHHPSQITLETPTPPA
eukprot:COSAG01_NODE_47920_length_385_cov_17.818182_1_plen_35_part_01